MQKKIWASLILLLLSLFLSLPCGFAGTDPAPSGKDKCAVCGMLVAKYPDWYALLVYRDGRRVWFDGAKDLLKGYLAPARYGLAKPASEVKAVWVKDYYSLSLIDGRKAFFVAGSDMHGAMGRELIPFAKESDARGFMKDHLGEKIVRFDQVSAEMLKKMD